MYILIPGIPGRPGFPGARERRSIHNEYSHAHSWACTDSGPAVTVGRSC